MKYIFSDINDTIKPESGEMSENERFDISIFSATYYNVAVGNASKEIKDMVDIVIDEVNNDGVAKYLNQMGA